MIVVIAIMCVVNLGLMLFNLGVAIGMNVGVPLPSAYIHSIIGWSLALFLSLRIYKHERSKEDGR